MVFCGENCENFLNDNSRPAYCQTHVLVAQLKYTKICIKIGYFVNLNMQGKKNFTPQLFVSVNLLDLVPEDNFYRKLLTELNLHFIYKATQKVLW